MIETIRNCKSAEEIFKAVNKYINSNTFSNKEMKYLKILQNNLKKSKDLFKSQEYCWNYVMASEGFIVKKDTITKKNWFKGTPIHGMECSNSNR